MTGVAVKTGGMLVAWIIMVDHTVVVMPALDPRRRARVAPQACLRRAGARGWPRHNLQIGRRLPHLLVRTSDGQVVAAGDGDFD